MNQKPRLQGIEYPVERTGLTEWRIYDLCRRGIFPHVRLGRQIRFDPEQVEAWIAAGGQALPGGWRQEAS